MLGQGARHGVVLLHELFDLGRVGIESPGQLGQRAVELPEIVALVGQQLHGAGCRRDELVEAGALAVEVRGQVRHQAPHGVGVERVERVLQFLEHLVGGDRDRRVILRDRGARRQVGAAGVARVQVDVGRPQQLRRDERREGCRRDPRPLVHGERHVDLVTLVLHVGDRADLDAEDVDGGTGEEPGALE